MTFGNKKTIVVGKYTIDAGTNTSFTVILKENKQGFREFDIVLSKTGSDDYSEVYNHPFYNNFVLPWSYRQKEIDEPEKETIVNNVVNLDSFRNKITTPVND